MKIRKENRLKCAKSSHCAGTYNKDSCRPILIRLAFFVCVQNRNMHLCIRYHLPFAWKRPSIWVYLMFQFYIRRLYPFSALNLLDGFVYFPATHQLMRRAEFKDFGMAHFEKVIMTRISLWAIWTIFWCCCFTLFKFFIYDLVNGILSVNKNIY